MGDGVCGRRAIGIDGAGNGQAFAGGCRIHGAGSEGWYVADGAGCDFGSECGAGRAGGMGVGNAVVMLPTEQAAARNAALIGKVVVKAAMIERAAVVLKEASGLDIENDLRHLQACLSSTGVTYVSGCFFGPTRKLRS